MGEDTEDVKPKIDLTINYDGQSQYPSRGCILWNGALMRFGSTIFFSRSVHD